MDSLFGLPPLSSFFSVLIVKGSTFSVTPTNKTEEGRHDTSPERLETETLQDGVCKRP